MNFKATLLAVVAVLCMMVSADAQSKKNMPKLIDYEIYTSSELKEAIGYYNDAQNAFEKGNYKKAAELYKKAIAIDSNYIDAYDNLAVSFRRLNLLDSAEYYFLLSHAKYPKGAVALNGLAVIETFRGNHEKELRYYKQLINLDPEDPEGYYGSCRANMLLNNGEEALKNGQLAAKYYEEKNSPHLGDSYYLLCLVCLKNGDKSLAKKYYSLAKSEGVKIDKTIENALK